MKRLFVGVIAVSVMSITIPVEPGFAQGSSGGSTCMSNSGGPCTSGNTSDGGSNKGLENPRHERLTKQTKGASKALSGSRSKNMSHGDSSGSAGSMRKLGGNKQ